MAHTQRNKFTTLADYARHRGVSRRAVTEAIQTGRLRESLTRKPNGQPAISNVAHADREWAANTQGSARTLDAIDAAGVPPIAVSRARLEAAKASLATMELLEKKGKLVSVDAARVAVAEKFSAVKTRLLGLPTRIRQRMPHISAEDIRQIDDLMREALEELSGGPHDTTH